MIYIKCTKKFCAFFCKIQSLFKNKQEILISEILPGLWRLLPLTIEHRTQVRDGARVAAPLAAHENLP